MENGHAPATKHDLEQVRSEIQMLRAEMKENTGQLRSEINQNTEQLRSEINQNTEQLRSEMNHQYNDVIEQIRDTETKLLSAFYGFSQTNSLRMTELEGN